MVIWGLEGKRGVVQSRPMAGLLDTHGAERGASGAESQPSMFHLPSNKIGVLPVLLFSTFKGEFLLIPEVTA